MIGRRTVSIVLAAALAVAACVGDSPTADDAPGDVAEATTGAAPTTTAISTASTTRAPDPTTTTAPSPPDQPTPLVVQKLVVAGLKR